MLYIVLACVIAAILIAIIPELLCSDSFSDFIFNTDWQETLHAFLVIVIVIASIAGVIFLFSKGIVSIFK